MIQAFRTLAVLAVVLVGSAAAAADSGRAAGQRLEPSRAASGAQRAAHRERVAHPLKHLTAAQLADVIMRIIDKQEREAKARETQRPR